VGLVALHVDHKADATGIMFVSRIIEPLLGGGGDDPFSLVSFALHQSCRIPFWERDVSTDAKLFKIQKSRKFDKLLYCFGWIG
jgi:hypothetical protein